VKTYLFKPEVSIVGAVSPVASIPELEREQGVYSATPDFVRKHCGPIANQIMERVGDWYFKEATALGLYPNIDVRVHRLYPGDYPAYPGWHCDGEFRETYFSQPDLDRIKVGKHIIATVSSVEGGVSNCQFLNEPLDVTLDHEPSSEHTLWGQVHKKVPDNAYTLNTQDGFIYQFDSRSLHRVMPAKVRGWRLFFRMSMWHKPNLGDGGMVTKQEQVYKLVEGGGW